MPRTKSAAAPTVAAPKGTRVAVYLRVSTDGQTVDNQRLALAALCEQRGWTIIQEYADEGISGAKGRDKRPGLDKALKDATRGRFDIFMAWSIDRIGRSLSDLLHTLQDLDAAHVGLVLHQQALDTTSPAGRLMFQMVGAFAEFERSMIRSRVMAGLDRAKARGRRLGRPFVNPDKEAACRAAFASGAGILKAASLAGIGSSAAQRIRREMLDEAKAKAA